MTKMRQAMRRHFEQMEEAEAGLRAQLTAEYAPVLVSILSACHSYLISGARPNERISSDYARQTYMLASENGVPNRAGKLFSFDEIRRMPISEALGVQLVSLQQKQAGTSADLIDAHLRAEVAGLWLELERIRDIDINLSKALLDSVAVDESYPVRQVLRNNHAKLARNATSRLLQDQARGMGDSAILRDVSDYLARETRKASDAVIYYEGTRITADTVIGFFAEYDAFTGSTSRFRTVCIDDRLTCDVCRSIEEAQKESPVDLDEKATGINCPPFHPFCRCWVEIV